MGPKWEKDICQICLNTVVKCLGYIENKEVDRARNTLYTLYKHISEWQESWEKEDDGMDKTGCDGGAHSDHAEGSWESS